MEEIEKICLEIIAAVGSARSCYVEAIQDARKNNFNEANEKIKEGKNLFVLGHKAHAKLIQKDACDEGGLNKSLLLIHAEDQLMSAETIQIIAEEFIKLYKEVRLLRGGNN